MLTNSFVEPNMAYYIFPRKYTLSFLTNHNLSIGRIIEFDQFFALKNDSIVFHYFLIDKLPVNLARRSHDRRE